MTFPPGKSSTCGAKTNSTQPLPNSTIPATAIAIQKLNYENTTQNKGDRQLNPSP
ncbi:hypothetical protein [Nostoc sp. CCY 9925]|uniref:hypothetical protein n=1 Tax=Nostoc sp. CCY 9925 TaxID=3103865 RepID=UPI0039C656F9